MKKPLYDRAIFTEPYGELKPVNYRGYLLPEYFKAFFYFFDNDTRTITATNAKDFKTWSLEILIRVTKAETLEIVQSSILGASAYRGHITATTKAFNPANYDPVKAHFQIQVKIGRAHV
jgi:hypothetical protein